MRRPWQEVPFGKIFWADNQTIEIDKKEGAVKLVFTTSQWIPVLRWVLSFGENARPLEPDWFVEEWKTNIIKMFDFKNNKKILPGH